MFAFYITIAIASVSLFVIHSPEYCNEKFITFKAWLDTIKDHTVREMGSMAYRWMMHLTDGQWYGLWVGFVTVGGLFLIILLPKCSLTFGLWWMAVIMSTIFIPTRSGLESLAIDFMVWLRKRRRAGYKWLVKRQWVHPKCCRVLLGNSMQFIHIESDIDRREGEMIAFFYETSETCDPDELRALFTEFGMPLSETGWVSFVVETSQCPGYGRYKIQVCLDSDKKGILVSHCDFWGGRLRFSSTPKDGGCKCGLCSREDGAYQYLYEDDISINTLMAPALPLEGTNVDCN